MTRMSDADVLELKRQYGSWERLAKAVIGLTNVTRERLELPLVFKSKRGPKAGRRIIFDEAFYFALRRMVIAERRKKQFGKRISEVIAIKKVLIGRPSINKKTFTSRDFKNVYKKYNELKNEAKARKRMFLQKPQHLQNQVIPEWQSMLPNTDVPIDAIDPTDPFIPQW